MQRATAAFCGWCGDGDGSCWPATLETFIGIGGDAVCTSAFLAVDPENYSEIYLQSLTSVTIPETVKEIYEYAFKGTGITSISIPDSVEGIYEYAFASTGITSFRMPRSLTSLSWNAFDDCSSLTSISIPNERNISEVLSRYNHVLWSLSSITINFEGDESDWLSLMDEAFSEEYESYDNPEQAWRNDLRIQRHYKL